MHVLVADIDACPLDDGAAHHLGRVLRVRDGEEVTALDGSGSSRACVARRSGRAVELEPVAEPVRHLPPEPRLAVAFALLKGERNELIVQKLTELGIDLIVPVLTERTVVRWDAAKVERNHERLTAVARAAVMQCGRVWLPSVSRPAPLAEALTWLQTTPGAVCLADAAGGPLPDRCRGIVIGPEGGFTAEEREEAKRQLGPPVRLAAHTLRAETAAVAAGALLAGRRDGALREAEKAPD